MRGLRLRLAAIVVTVCAVGAALFAAVVPPAGAGAATTANQLRSPFPVAKTPSVKGHPLAKGSHHLTVHESAGVPVQEYRPLAAPAWPAAGSGVAYLDGAAAPWSGQQITCPAGVALPAPPGQAGTLPVWVSGASAGRSPEGADAARIQDRFNKSLVARVDVADETGASSPGQVTNCSYLGEAAWHDDDSPLTESSQRTWDQFRGYAQVETTIGAAPDPVTESISTDLRGMNGDNNGSRGTTSATVTDSLGDSVTDSNWFSGQILESDTYTASGGTIDAKPIYGPWTFNQTASQAQPDGLPTLTAEMPQATESRSLALLANGGRHGVGPGDLGLWQAQFPVSVGVIMGMGAAA